jgi:hypothetical protein
MLNHPFQYRAHLFTFFPSRLLRYIFEYGETAFAVLAKSTWSLLDRIRIDARPTDRESSHHAVHKPKEPSRNT